MYIQLLYSLQELIRKLKERLANIQEAKKTIISDLMDEKQQFVDTITILRNRLRDEHTHDISQLTTLTAESNASLKVSTELATIFIYR
jgi:Mg2+ and Co2+ transporter CorA